MRHKFEIIGVVKMSDRCEHAKLMANDHRGVEQTHQSLAQSVREMSLVLKQTKKDDENGNTFARR